MKPPRIRTTVAGSYPLPDWLAAAPSEQALEDATRVVLHTQETAGIDLVCDGELYRFDLNHPESDGMIGYFARPMQGIRSEIGFGLGVVDIKPTEIGTPEAIARAIERAEKIPGRSRVKYVHPDCGFWMLKRNIADGKIRALVKGRNLYEGR